MGAVGQLQRTCGTARLRGWLASCPLHDNMAVRVFIAMAGTASPILVPMQHLQKPDTRTAVLTAMLHGKPIRCGMLCPGSGPWQ